MIGFTLGIDDLGRLVSTLWSDANAALVMAANAAEAADDLEQAIEAARAAGSGECVWRELTGDFRWILRRTEDRLRVAVMHSTGTLTGWHYVFGAEADFEEFAACVCAELESVRGPR